MIVVKSIEVRSFDLDHLDIFWELDSFAEPVDRYDFFILRSVDGPVGPFTTIGGPFYNQYVFRDPDVHQLNKWRSYYYKVKVVHRETQVTAEYGPEWLRAPPDRISLEVQRREGLMFKEHIGRAVILFPQLTSGQRCNHCWDRGVKNNTIGRAVSQNCPSCFDTTFVGGYAQPILIYVQIDPYAKTTQRTEVSEQQYVETSARCAAFPPIKTRDMLVERENLRWRVEMVNATEKLRSTVRQELKLRQYPPGDIKFKVPINLGVMPEFSPGREFTRPFTTPVPSTSEGANKYSQPQLESSSTSALWWEQ